METHRRCLTVLLSTLVASSSRIVAAVRPMEEMEPEGHSLVQRGATILRPGTGASTPPSSKVPTASRERLEMLCGTLGLERACTALKSEGHNPLPLHAADLRKTHLPYTGDAKCLPPGKLIFIHVMKTGGMSVDWFLNKACSERDAAVCSVQRLDFEPHTIVQPEQRNCTPSICTIGNPGKYVCGEEFAHAKSFTVLRDPVERVWSFYNMLREWYKPYQEKDLKWILNHQDVDLDKGLKQGDRCKLCHYQLKNAMVKRHFGRFEGKNASQVLAGLDAIFDVHALGHLPEVAAEKRLFPELPSLSGQTALTVPRNNDLPYAVAKYPDDETAALISHANDKDIELFEYAKTLPNFVGGEETSSLPWPLRWVR